jgi:hypothetical protein
MIHSNKTIYGKKIRNACQIQIFLARKKSGITNKNKKKITAGTQYCFTTSMVAKLTHNHNTIQNTTHNLHNNQQNEPPPYTQRLCPLSPWVEQRRPQIFEPPLPNAIHRS